VSGRPKDRVRAHQGWKDLTVHALPP